MTARVPGWFDPQDERTARAAWSRIAEPGDETAARVLEHLGPGPALLALYERPVRLRELAASIDGRRRRPGQPAPGAGWEQRLPQVEPLRDLRTLERFGGRLLIPGDPQWPQPFAALGARTPPALWARGPVDLTMAVHRAVALVGSRAASPYGEDVAADLGAGSVERGVTVVSGAAYGIDAQAHRGALAGGGPTVAVVACGVDRAYPRGNEQLIERIAREGLVVSEVPPGSSPTRWRFVQRNRLIAALSRATVVVEAAWRSGAMITAGEAVSLGREVGAVPGPVTSAASAGCHRLLREGAVCVTDADEIVELLSPIGAAPAPARSAPASEHDGLDPIDLRVFDALPVRSAVGVDRLAGTAGLDGPVVAAALGRLQLRGLAVEGGGLWRRAPRRGAADPWSDRPAVRR